MSKIQAIVVRGPFTEDDFALLVATIREIDGRHPDDTFEVVAVDPTDTAIETAEAMLKQAVPSLPGRETTFKTIRRKD